jgi:hypothetical protein
MAGRRFLSVARLGGIDIFCHFFPIPVNALCHRNRPGLPSRISRRGARSVGCGGAAYGERFAFGCAASRTGARSRLQFEKGGTALGVLEKINLQDRFAALEPGDAVVLFTDGITEAFSREDGIYGEERFWATVRAYSNASAQDMLAAIDESVAAFVGDDPPSDDVTLMVLHRLAS